MSQRKKKSEKNRQRHPLRTVAILAVVFAVVFIGGKIALDQIFHFSADRHNPSNENFIDAYPNENGEPVEENPIVVEQLLELRSQGDLSSVLKDWALNGSENEHTLMQSRKVINFLLVGLDEAAENSDVLMMLSLNTETKKVYLTSFMRDSYTYIKAPQGDVYAKINASYVNGGIQCLIETLQNDYKIKIDHYVCVNFKTFVEIVDILGGVRLPVQAYEAREMERCDDNRVGVPYPVGDDALLNGFQALMYCRIRYCDFDGDVSRTRRQRLFVTTMMQRAKHMTVSEATDIIKSLITYVKTDCDVSDLIGYATRTLMNRWYEYEVISFTLPELEDRMDYSGSQWVWIVDYPAAAAKLQKAIYGETNITLNPDRLTAIDVMKNRSGAGYYVEDDEKTGVAEPDTAQPSFYEEEDTTQGAYGYEPAEPQTDPPETEETFAPETAPAEEEPSTISSELVPVEEAEEEAEAEEEDLWLG